MITKAVLPAYLRPGCIVTTSRRRYLVVKISDDMLSFLGRPCDRPSSLEVNKPIANITVIHHWPIPKEKLSGWIRLRSHWNQDRPSPIRPTDIYHDNLWAPVDYNNNIKGFNGEAIFVTPGIVDKWTPVRPDDLSTGEVRVDHAATLGNTADNTASMIPGHVPVRGPMVPPPDWPVVAPEDAIFKIEKEIKMEDIKLFKPENLARAKEIAEQERNDEETQKAKTFYENCINTIDKIDRQMKALAAEKKEWEEKLQPFRDAVTSNASPK